MDDLANVTYEDLHAIHDHMGKTLRLSGTVVVQGGGLRVSVSLRPAGINPSMLMLTLLFAPDFEAPGRQELFFEMPWPEGEQGPTQVSLVSEGYAAAPPGTLDVEDIY